MANLKNVTELQSEGTGDVYAPPSDLSTLVIAEENPAHPNHAEHTARVEPSRPENIALLASLREHGWPKSQTASIYRDGARFVVSNGRRRLTFVRIENDRRARESDPRGPIRPRFTIDDRPLLTETIGNSMHLDDPPMVKARRFMALREGGMPAAAAAAALGLSLADAQALAVVEGVPEPALHAAVNSKLLPPDVAARAAKAGSETVAKVVDAAKAASAEQKERASGKPVRSKVGRPAKPENRAKNAAKKAIPKRARAVNANRIQAVADVLRESDGGIKVAAALDWAAGGDSPPAWLQKAIDAAKEAEK